MSKVVNIKDFKKSKELEDEYLKFLAYINKYLKTPTSIPELSKTFYFILRYLEGTVNCFNILSFLKPVDPQESDQLRNLVINYLDGLLKDMDKF